MTRPRIRANTHIHLPPNFSAFDSVDEAVDYANSEDIVILGASNYYDHTVYREFAERCRAWKVAPLFGIEILAMDARLRDTGIKVNDPGNPGKTYLCGKGIAHFAEPTAAAQALLSRIRTADEQRMRVMTQRLDIAMSLRGFGGELAADRIIDQIAKRCGAPRKTVVLQERHLAQALQGALFDRILDFERLEFLADLLGAMPRCAPNDSVAVQNAIRSHLLKTGKPAFVEEKYVSVEEAKRLVLELGGIPSYPVLLDGAKPLCPFEETPETLIANVRALGTAACELIPVRNRPEMLERYVLPLRAAGFAVTAGTEHNTLEMIPIAPTALDGAPIPEAVQRIFGEGALVALGHQTRVLAGETGFVDHDGHPNAAYTDAESRIRAFAAMGEAAVGKLIET